MSNFSTLCGGNVSAKRKFKLGATVGSEVEPGKAPYSATITLAAASAGSQAATVQLVDAFGTNISGIRIFDVFVSGADTGVGLDTNGITAVTATTGTILNTITSKKQFVVQSDSAGKAVLACADANSGRTFYLVIKLVDGSMAVSTAVIPTPAG